MSLIHGKKGKIVFTAAASLTAITISGAYTLPYLFPDSFRKMTIDNKYGEKSDLPPEMAEMVDQVTNDIGLPKEHKNIITPYISNGISVIHAGRFHSSMFDNKYCLGIPTSFLAKEKGDLPLDLNMGFNHHIDWQSNIGQQLRESVVLSEFAKKFIIAQTICLGEATLNLQHFCISTAGLLGNVFLCKGVNNKFDLFKKPLMLRCLMYCSLTYLCVSVTFGIVDHFSLNQVSEVDKRIINISPAYAAGAIDYYTAMLHRNKIMYQIPKYRSMFTEEGNERRHFTGGFKLTDNLEYIQNYINSKKDS